MVASPPKVNFTVVSDGAVKTGLTLADTSFAIARLIPASGGNPAAWTNYVSLKATAAPGDVVTWTITVSNPSNKDVKDADITDDISALLARGTLVGTSPTAAGTTWAWTGSTCRCSRCSLSRWRLAYIRCMNGRIRNSWPKRS